MKQDKIAYYVVIFFIFVFGILTFTPESNDITSRDFHFSGTDKIIKQLSYVKMPDKKDISNFSISFGLGNANRKPHIQIRFNSELEFDKIRNILFNEALLSNNVRLIKCSKTSCIYIGNSTEYELMYSTKNKSYSLYVTTI